MECFKVLNCSENVDGLKTRLVWAQSARVNRP